MKSGVAERKKKGMPKGGKNLLEKREGEEGNVAIHCSPSLLPSLIDRFVAISSHELDEALISLNFILTVILVKRGLSWQSFDSTVEVSTRRVSPLSSHVRSLSRVSKQILTGISRNLI